MIYFVRTLFGFVEVNYATGHDMLPQHPHTKWEHPHPQDWYDLRWEALERDSHTCQNCFGASGCKTLQIHHWTYDRWGHELLSDLHTVCRDCHEKIHRQMQRRTA